MPQADVTAQFTKVMSKLMAQHKKHLAIIAKSSAKVAEVEALFGQFGITLDSGKPVPKGKQKAKKAGRRKRGVFKETAEEFILGLLKGKSLSTAEVNKAWHGASRGGKADTSLSKLVKSKKLKKTKVKGMQGSSYSLA